MQALLHLIKGVARGMALLGGIVLTLLIILACVSILGRGLNSIGNADWLAAMAPGFADWLIGTGVGPVTGDFELIEAGIAFAIFAFLPICQMQASHAVVDVFTNPLPSNINRMLIAFWEVVFAIVVVVIGWRLFVGMTDKLGNGQTTFLLQFPVWWAYAASFAAAFVAMLVGIYCAVARVAGLMTGTDILGEGEGAGH